MSLELVTATIPNGGSLTPAIKLGDRTLVGISMPASWTTANLSFQVSVDGTNFQELNSSSAAIGVTASAGIYIQLDPSIFIGVNIIKVRSGTSGSAVAQGADRVLTLVTRAMDGV